MLDMLCLAGEVAWRRLSVPALDPASPPRLVPATPVALYLREHAGAWQSPGVAGDAIESVLSVTARRVLDALRARGASFFNDLADCAIDAHDLRDAIGALVACGLVASDGFSGLRALVWAARGRRPVVDRRTNFAGRWSLLRTHADERAADTQAWTLLRRYGIVFRRVLTRETNVAPWRDLTRVYRRLEARGEIRGGRFVAGMSGEQFALPDAVERLREIRRSPANGRDITISAADPLNLAGIVTPGERIRAVGRHRLAYRDGVPLALNDFSLTAV
jgi:ATP-dependent Lhr-like helicase